MGVIVDHFAKKSIRFLIFCSFFACTGLIAAPTSIELRGKDLKEDQPGVFLPRQDIAASSFLSEICGYANQTQIKVPLPGLAHHTIERYAPCLSMIAEGHRHSEVAFVTQQRLRAYLLRQPDLYESIIFADYLNVPLLLNAALAQAPAHITTDNVVKYEECFQGAPVYNDLCQAYMQAHPSIFMAPSQVHSFQSAYSIWSKGLALSPNSGIVAFEGAAHNVELRSVHTGELHLTLDAHTRSITCIEFSPDGTTIATGSFDNTVKLWRVEDGQLLGTLQVQGVETHRINSLAFSLDGNILVIGSEYRFPNNGTITLWDARNRSLIKNFPCHAGVASVAISPDGTSVAVGCSNGNLELWDAHTGTIRHRHRVADDSVVREIQTVSFSPDGAIIAATSPFAQVKLWEVPTGRHALTLGGTNWGIQWVRRSGISSIAYYPNSLIIASGYFDGEICLWNTQTGSLLASFNTGSHHLRNIAFSPDGTKLAVLNSSREGTTMLFSLYPRELRNSSLAALVETKALASRFFSIVNTITSPFRSSNT